MSQRIGIGFNVPGHDVCWVDTDDKNKLKKIVDEYIWNLPLKIYYLEGKEKALLELAEALEKKGMMPYEKIWMTFKVNFSQKMILEHKNIKELEKQVKKNKKKLDKFAKKNKIGG